METHQRRQMNIGFVPTPLFRRATVGTAGSNHDFFMDLMKAPLYQELVGNRGVFRRIRQKAPGRPAVTRKEIRDALEMAGKSGNNHPSYEHWILLDEWINLVLGDNVPLGGIEVEHIEINETHLRCLVAMIYKTLYLEIESPIIKALFDVPVYELVLQDKVSLRRLLVGGPQRPPISEEEFVRALKAAGRSKGNEQRWVLLDKWCGTLQDQAAGLARVSFEGLPNFMGLTEGHMKALANKIREIAKLARKE